MRLFYKFCSGCPLWQFLSLCDNFCHLVTIFVTFTKKMSSCKKTMWIVFKKIFYDNTICYKKSWRKVKTWYKSCTSYCSVFRRAKAVWQDKSENRLLYGQSETRLLNYIFQRPEKIFIFYESESCLRAVCIPNPVRYVPSWGFRFFAGIRHQRILTIRRAMKKIAGWSVTRDHLIINLKRRKLWNTKCIGRGELFFSWHVCGSWPCRFMQAPRSWLNGRKPLKTAS